MFNLTTKKQEQVNVDTVMNQVTERLDLFLTTIERMIEEKEERSAKLLVELISGMKRESAVRKGTQVGEIKYTLSEQRLAEKNTRFMSMNKRQLRSEIARIIREIEVICSLDRRRVYRELYEELRQRTGVDFHSIKARKKYKVHATKLDALVEKGHGVDLAEIAQEMYEKRKVS